MSTLNDYVVFKDQKLAKRYANRPIPISVLYEAYFDGDLDIVGDIDRVLAKAQRVREVQPDAAHLRWAVTNFVPEVAIHSKSQDKRIVREHYDRGNDFFGWFLGERMVYTSGFFENPSQTLEQAQDNKIHLVCKKLALAPGERLLDIGCGWGTLASPRGEALRRRRDGRHDCGEPDGVRQRARQELGRRRPGARPLPGLPRHSRGQVTTRSSASRWSSTSA